jgi:glycosyltransferase involved in cell wall biosynthesis
MELERAIRSALAQDHPAIEVLVSDDASPDPMVERVASSFAANDSRVRFARQPRNLGHAGNYQWVLESARGEYFMWLSDDDWLDPGYVSACLAELRADSSVKLVCGLAEYQRDGQAAATERVTNLGSGRPGLRLLAYFSRVNINGALFSLARRSDLLTIGFPSVVGGDWLLVAAMARRGRVRTLEEVRIHRSASGIGEDPLALARSFGHSGLRARQHHLFLAATVWREIAGASSRFPELGPVAQVFVASGAAASIVTRFTLVGVFRRLVGPARANAVERRVSAWLRRWDSR